MPVPPSTFKVDEIENLDAETNTHTNYEICPRSGRKAYPGEMIRDKYTLEFVLKRYSDTAQQEPRSFSSTSGTGPQRAETDDIFITVAVTIDDL